MLEIRPAVTQEDFTAAKILIKEYAESLGFNLCFQQFDEEIASLEKHYGPPGGCLLLAYIGNKPVGCVALRQLEDGVCEMKRLYLRPDCRGGGHGKALTLEAIRQAKALGYKAIRLDTLERMTQAVALYRALGFRDISPYRHNPIEGAIYMELTLDA